MQQSFTRKTDMSRYITSFSRLHQNRVIVDGRLIFYQENILTFADFIKSVFKQEKVAYPKFYKMDAISKLGFLAAEMVMRGKKPFSYPAEKAGVVFCNSSSSLDTDMAHQETIRDRSAYFPSPSVFVYTLPNIVIGEVCIRHNFKGENAFLVSESFDAALLRDYVDELFENGRVEACLCGWIDLLGNQCDAMVALVEDADRISPESPGGFKPLAFSTENLEMIMKPN
jgi:hypothetical protein